MTSLGVARQALIAAAAAADDAGHPVLARNLRTEEVRLREHRCHVLVVGEFKKGKSALVNALLGIPLSGVDPLQSTEVPVVIGYADQAVAELTLEGEDSATLAVDVRSVARASLLTSAADGRPVAAVRIGLPRELLRRGIVLVDTPGVGGGLQAARASATMRALATADAVVHVSDAAQEYTAAELAFVQQALRICPSAVLVLAKTDAHPAWDRVLEINRQHLRENGVSAPLVPVSAALRELAIDTGDTALTVESGMALLSAEITRRLLPASQRRAASAAMTSVNQALQLLSAPAETPSTTGVSPRKKLNSAAIAASAQRWQYRLADRFAELQSRVDKDLAARCEQLEQEATDRIDSLDPARSWADLDLWLCSRVTEELAANQALLSASIDDVVADLAAEFGYPGGDVPEGSAGPMATAMSLADAEAEISADAVATGMAPLTFQRANALEVGMNAARGWSLSSSVVTTLIVATLNPGLIITLPVTGVLGVAFMFKTVRMLSRTQLINARAQAQRAVTTHLARSRARAARDNADLQRRTRNQLRDFLIDRAEEAAEAARRPIGAAR